MNKHKTMLDIPSKEEEDAKQALFKAALEEKMEGGQEQAKLLQAELNHTIRGIAKIVFRVEGFYLLYCIFAFTTLCETVVLLVWDLVSSILNIFLPIIGFDRIKRTSYFAAIIVSGCVVIVQDFDIFDVSVLYHFLRGQNTVKLYSIGMSIMVFQIFITRGGKILLGKLSKIIINSQTKFKELLVPLSLSFLYSIAHFFIIYIDFIVFVIILNSTSDSRLLFIFSMSLKKLSKAVIGKFDKNGYKNDLIFDAKDRLHKIGFSIILILTLEERIEDHLYFTILKALVFSSVIDYLRNLAALSHVGQLNHIKELRVALIEDLYLKEHSLDKHESIMKCLEYHFTVIPEILFLFKFINIIFKEIKKMDFNLIITYAFIFMVLQTIIARTVIWKWRKHKLQQGKTNTQEMREI